MLTLGISVACEVLPGTFMSEYMVRIEDSAGMLWHGSVDKEMICELAEEPKAERFVPGRMYAYLISVKGKSALIELPVENSNGRRLEVPVQLLQKERIPA